MKDKQKKMAAAYGTEPVSEYWLGLHNEVYIMNLKKKKNIIDWLQV